jgi:hypothetical protein
MRDGYEKIDGRFSRANRQALDWAYQLTFALGRTRYDTFDLYARSHALPGSVRADACGSTARQAGARDLQVRQPYLERRRARSPSGSGAISACRPASSRKCWCVPRPHNASRRWPMPWWRTPRSAKGATAKHWLQLKLNTDN